MSQNQLPSAEDAQDTLVRSVYAQVFFQKCAAAGLPARSEEEAGVMLEMAAKLRTISELDQVKSAAAADNPYMRMNANLDAVTGQYGLAAPVNQQSLFKAAAAELAKDPAIYEAALAMKANEAAQLAETFAARQNSGK